MEMKKFFLVLFFLALFLGLGEAFHFHENELETEESMWELYERWRSDHTVSRSLDEKHKRFNVFKANVHYVHNFNNKDKPYKLKLNKFADMTNLEFRTHYAGSKIKHYRTLQGTRHGNGTNFMYANVNTVPPSVDWRKKGAVTPVKDQGQCEDNYPYRAEDGKCNIQKENSPAVSIDGHEDVPPNDENALLKAAANQPVSVAVDASGSDFQFYSEGVFTGDCGTELDHGVAIVGYGTTVDGTKFWTVKNSWGAEWGEKGYIRMRRGIDAKEGLCGIAMEPSYPIKTSSNTAVSPKDEL
ncbi:hypothetical protein RND71_007991 [Anisodus tanguticus]|uniref:Uncharacterized protein n=1 Tax=Anisodus tanguticus TaxID=243964 RepID=A0AAE1VKL8_9SOLA|nr:hypothetical protein RND71_007991 [Anisodus tanguticus]